MKKLLPCLCAALSLMLAATPAARAGEALLDSEVSVDVTSKDGVDARDKALAKAEIDALTDLLGRLAPPGQAQEIISHLDAKKIESLVRGTEVLDEKISENRYRARLKVSFNAEDISSLVGKVGADSAQDAAPVPTSSFLIIPAFDDSGLAMLWDDKNPWRNLWKSLALEITSGDIVVPYGDNTDGSVIDLKSLASANYASLAPLMVRYGVSDVVILQATYTRTPEMSLSIIKRRINRTLNEVNLETYRADQQETRDMLLARASKDIAEQLLNKKMEELANAKEIHGGERNKIMVLASIGTLDSWTQLRSKLAALPMIDKMDLLAMSPQQVDMVIYYRGTAESLARGITDQKLRLVQNKDYWVISRD